jgi:hypothetical protein
LGVEFVSYLESDCYLDPCAKDDDVRAGPGRRARAEPDRGAYGGAARNARLNGNHCNRPPSIVSDVEVRSLLDAGNSMGDRRDAAGKFIYDLSEIAGSWPVRDPLASHQVD